MSQGNVRDHKDLDAWREAMAMVNDIYRLTARFPPAERYGLAGQLRRAAVSVPSNIAEGAGCWSAKEFRRYLSVARGSVAELETQLLIASELGYASNVTNVLPRVERLRYMLTGLIRSLSKVRSIPRSR